MQKVRRERAYTGLKLIRLAEDVQGAQTAESIGRDSSGDWSVAREKWHEKAAGRKPSGFF